MSHKGHSEALASLARRLDLPVRVHGVLVGLRQRSVAYFADAIERTLDELERELFKLADRSGSDADQQQCFAALRQIKLGRAGIAPLFFQHVEARLAEMRNANKEAPPAPARNNERARSALELVDVAAQDEDLALWEIAGKAEIRNGQHLYTLARRLGVLGAAPAWPSETLPLGPAQLTQAFQYALHGFDLNLEYRVLAYRLFDRTAMLAVIAFYENLNAYLIAQGILPNLQIQNRQRRADAPRDNFVEPPAVESPAGASQHDGSDPQLFKTLRNLLSERRHLDGGIGAVSDVQIFHASGDDLQTVLGALQHGSARAPAGPYDSEHFKNTLQVKLRRASPAGRPLRLSEEDSDTVDLVGMLFGYINQNVKEGSGARALLNKLHVPVLRVALSDKTFFTRRDHPARDLLNTIAETGARWIDDSESDPELVKNMQLVVDHVGADFDGDVGVFETLLGDLSGHMQLLARRAEVIERRHIDAAKGRDKLDIARDTARAAIARVVQHSTPMPLVRSLLEQAWTDALALSALRGGESSIEFKRRIVVAEKLSRLATQSTPAETVDATLRDDLDAGLRQVGLHEDDVNGVLASLLPPTGTTRAMTSENLSRIDNALRSKTPLGGDVGKSAMLAATHAAMPLNAAEADMLKRIRKIPFGTWFEFVTNQQGQSVRRKLAWFSTVTGRCLFVNQRGARTEDRALHQLARDMVRGQARLAEAEHTSLIDRAWKAITDALRPHAVHAAEVNP